MVSEELAKLMGFLPKAVIAMVIFAIGYFVAGLVRDVLGNATEALGVGAGRLIAGAVYWFLLITVILRTPSGRTVLPASELTTKRVEILEA